MHAMRASPALLESVAETVSAIADGGAESTRRSRFGSTGRSEPPGRCDGRACSSSHGTRAMKAPAGMEVIKLGWVALKIGI